MSFENIVQKTWQKNILFSVLIELTYRCNLNCFFCYNDLELAGSALGRERYLRLLEELRDLQVLNLVLTGGEPLAHPDFFEIGNKARSLGFVIRLKSNGHMLRGEMLARLRQEVDPFLVEVSLHGARAETHDRQTRVPGSFERLVANLHEMVAAGLRVKINSTLTRWNEAEIEDMFALARSLDVALQVDPIVTPRDNGDLSPLQISPSRQGVARLMELQSRQGEAAMESHSSTLEVGREGDTILPRPANGESTTSKSATSKYCGAGSSGLAIDPYGNVYPCVQWRHPIGNLHESSIGELWSHSRELESLRQTNEEVKRTIEQLGEKGKYLSFCPGQAALETGSPLGIYRSAEQRAEEALRLQAPEPFKKNLLPVVP